MPRTCCFNYGVYDMDNEVSRIMAIPQELYSLNVEVDYSISPYRAATLYDPPEYAEVELYDIRIVEVECDGGFFRITKKQSEMIEHLVEWNFIEEYCFEDNKGWTDDYDYYLDYD